MSRRFEKCSITYTTNETGVSIVSTTDCTDGWRYFDPEPYSEDRSFISEVSDKLLVCHGKNNFKFYKLRNYFEMNITTEPEVFNQFTLTIGLGFRS
jgi:hypothetical protein